MQVQQSMGQAIDKVTAWYKDTGSDGVPPIGGSVCWDMTESVDPLAGEFDEQVRHKVVVKPKTANLGFWAGIVAEAKDYAASNGFYEVVLLVPRRGQSLGSVLTKAAQTINATLLEVKDDQWELGVDAAFGETTIGKAAETVDTSVTAAKSGVYFV